MSITDARWARFNEVASGYNVTPTASSWPVTTRPVEFIRSGSITAERSPSLANHRVQTGEFTTVAAFDITAHDEGALLNRIKFRFAGVRELGDIRVYLDGYSMYSASLPSGDPTTYEFILNSGEQPQLGQGGPNTLRIEMRLPAEAAHRNLALTTSIVTADTYNGIQVLGFESGELITLPAAQLPILGQTVWVD
ncbi:hypothetical protein CO046_02765 [Candidatus Peregrinibacteria bacterium CG_4_9_14_0_2_um_filter_53_11]|nr:MAG: hypothetical protein CO046_02765 [Candidatus Peregrinibacteria bacterium CG_4_9_14_0_2_um_filter_53_11]